MRKIYERIISDVAMEISIMSEWRYKIFRMNDKILEISYKTPSQLPLYIKDEVVSNKLTFFVQVVNDCPVNFDEGLIIFKFWAKDYPDVCCYSGNNPDVI